MGNLGESWKEVRGGGCGGKELTPGSEVRVPLKMWPRTRVPPSVRLPLPIWNCDDFWFLVIRARDCGSSYLGLDSRYFGP